MNLPIAKFLRIVRLDESDSQVYELAAEAGEWAVVGSFYFWDTDLEAMSGKTRQAFSHGFLGTDSFGWGSLVVVAEISPIELEYVSQRLAQHLVDKFGAPSVSAALPAAREEVAFVQSLCDHDVDTLLSITREFAAAEITESFKVIQPPTAGDHATVAIWGPEDDLSPGDDLGPGDVGYDAGR